MLLLGHLGRCVSHLAERACHAPLQAGFSERPLCCSVERNGVRAVPISSSPGNSPTGPHDRDLFKRHRAGLKNASQTLAAVGLAEGPTLAFSVNKSSLGHGVDHMEVRRTLYTEIRSDALDVSRKQRVPRRTRPERRV